jgi:hypothetical protein
MTPLERYAHHRADLACLRAQTLRRYDEDAELRAIKWRFRWLKLAEREHAARGYRRAG